MLKFLLVLCAVTTVSREVAAQAYVRVEPVNLQGPRILQEQAKAAAVRDYLKSWQSLKDALQQNRVDLLNSDFVGVARDKLADTIQQQAALGIHTTYEDRAHDIQFVFYSPEGLSLELKDNVEYDLQIFDHDKVTARQRVRASYIVVLTPAEVRWKVRVLQSVPE